MGTGRVPVPVLSGRQARHEGEGREMLKTVSVTLGRNVAGVPVSVDEWKRRERSLEAVVRFYAETVHTVAEGLGEWDGQREESFIIVFAIDEGRLEVLRPAIGVLAILWDQDAIALVVGETELVS